MHQTQTFHCPDCVLNVPYGESQPQKIRRLRLAFVLLLLFAAGECWAGWLSHSLALQAEAGHMVADCGAIALALFAAWLAQRSHQRLIGGYRIEVLAALVNGIGLLVVGGLIGWEAIEQFQTPPSEILSTPMLITASVGLVINTLNALLLHQHSHADLNLRGAFLHMVADIISSIGVIIAAIAVWQFHWVWMDSAISFVVAGLILVGAAPLIRQSLTALLAQSPLGVTPDAIATQIQQIDGINQVLYLQFRSSQAASTSISDTNIDTKPTNTKPTNTKPTGTYSAVHLILDATVPSGQSREHLIHTVHTLLQAEFGIETVTIQFAQPQTLLPMLTTTKLTDLIQLN
ncbi:MAG: cation diffusion facilitator family transporter [Thainema sp.]